MFKLFKKQKLNQEVLNLIEEELLLADLGVVITNQIVTAIKKQKFGENITLEELKDFAGKIIIEQLKDYQKTIWITNKPHVILVFGTNGSGKTTTIAKLAAHLKNLGFSKILLAAGDTFRSGATEQLQIWGERLNMQVFTCDKNGNPIKDPAALVYQACQRAKDEDFDVVICDTSGRFTNNQNLMQELQKIEKVVKKIDPSYPHENILVLDGTLGQSSSLIAEGFLATLPINSLIITKLDGSSKGGGLVPLAQKLKLPILFIGVGEKIPDLVPFTPTVFAKKVLEL